MALQMQQPIKKSPKGRHRILPSLQCSVCMGTDAIVKYKRHKNGKMEMSYIHRDQIVAVKYYKHRKTGRKFRQLIYKVCKAGIVNEGLPLANENLSTEKEKEKIKETVTLSGNVVRKQAEKTESKIDYKELYLEKCTEVEELIKLIRMLISNHAKSVRRGVVTR